MKLETNEIFKESNVLTDAEQTLLENKFCKYFNDTANGIYAFDLLSDYDADDIVNELNGLNDDNIWFVGDKDEEYVYCL